MKNLSNKILVGFFGFILLYMIVSFAEIRFKGDKRSNAMNHSDDYEDAISETFENPIRHIKILSTSRLSAISILSSDLMPLDIENNSLVIKAKDHDPEGYIKYEVNGDTLVYTDSSDRRDGLIFWTNIYIQNDELKSITCSGASVMIDYFQLNSLSISQEQNRTTLGNSNQIDSLRLTLSGRSYFDTHDTELDYFYVDADNSDIQHYSVIKHLDGTLKNNSEMRVSSIHDISFKKDDSSKLYIQ